MSFHRLSQSGARRGVLFLAGLMLVVLLGGFPAAVCAQANIPQPQVLAREVHGVFWQGWTAATSSSLARLDILAGTSGAACSEVSGTLRILEVVSSSEKVVLHTQPVSTTCAGAQLTLNTCVFAPACRRGAWLAWQQFSLVNTQGSQHYLSLVAGRTYVAELAFSSSGVAAAVQSSSTPGLSSSLAKNPQFNSFVVRLSFNEPGAVVTGAFASVLLSSGENAREDSSSSSSSSVFSSSAVSGVLIALISLVAVVLLFLTYRAIRSPTTTTATPLALAPIQEDVALHPLHPANNPGIRRRASISETYDEESAVESPRRFSTQARTMALPGSHADLEAAMA
eukprot:m.247381 g.247381  ORF g.247381 m.247381 type:complete len:339 (+) comp50603_c0_seq1:207-1223(+)